MNDVLFIHSVKCKNDLFYYGDIMIINRHIYITIKLNIVDRMNLIYNKPFNNGKLIFLSVLLFIILFITELMLSYMLIVKKNVEEE